MLAAPGSGSGKTMITCGILRALLRRGIRTAAFKCGPDYIDPQFHESVVGVPSRNLDTFFTDEATVRYLFRLHAEKAELSVTEGVMGFYDGLGGVSVKASSYELAKITAMPVVLVIDARGKSLSVLAELKGFLEYRKDSGIVGVIFNRMSDGMYRLLAPKVEEELGIRPIGYVPECPDCRLESRHLGLVQPNEITGLSEQLDDLACILEKTLDLDKMIELAQGAPGLLAPLPERLSVLLESTEAEKIRRQRPLIGLARDEAFSFIYEDNLRLLRDFGAEFAEFSPIRDGSIPKGVSGLLFYGGYPELYAEKLSCNEKMLGTVRNAIGRGMPCMAECGGYMYLSEEMEDMEKRSWPMAGVVPGKCTRTDRLSRFGYIELSPEAQGIFSIGTEAIRGHEFHYFDSTDCGNAYKAKKPTGRRSWECIHETETLLAGFPHLYYYSCPELALEYLRKCCEFGGKELCGRICG